MKEEIGSQCRLYKQHEETIDHLTSGWPILAKNKYLMRHDRAGAFLHYSICKAIGIEKTKGAQTHTHAHTHIYIYTHTHTQKPVCEHGDGGVLRNQETEFTANTPDK